MLLAQFSEANSKLANENDKLRAGRQALADDHAEVLNEIEMLRGRLNVIEDVATPTSAASSRAPSRAHGGTVAAGGAPVGLPRCGVCNKQILVLCVAPFA